jgi:hypothetical protein
LAAQVSVSQHMWVVWLQMPPVHMPHVTELPQPSGKVPHSPAGKSAQVIGLHGGPHTPFALQTCPMGHCPQLIILPVHALVIDPHVCPTATHSTGVVAGSHWLASPSTPQLCPAGHPSPVTVSQSTVPPHPFVMSPHCAPAAAQSVAAVPGVQSGSQMLNALLQTLVPGHVPQFV